MVERLVVVGADAAGMSAASQARRRRGADDLEILVFEQGEYSSYSACGIPYWVGGLIDNLDDLIARTPQQHRDKGIDLRTGHKVLGLDAAARRVTVRDRDGRETEHPFDQLMLATGGEPLRPDWPGIDARGVHGIQNLADGDDLHGTLRSAGGGAEPRRAVVIGGGYIGVEMAEAMLRRGLTVTIVERAAEPMGTLDPDMGAKVHAAMTGLGIDVRTGVSVKELLVGDDGWVRAVGTDAGELPADVVVLGLGVRPASGLAADAGLPIGPTGGVVVDQRMRIPGHPGFWAAGDCVQVTHRITGQPTAIALGTHANKQGRVAGINLGGGYARFAGVVGTAVSQVCDREIARTGLSSEEAETAGFDAVTATIESTAQAGYYPDAALMTVKMLAERGSGRLLGAQIVGGPGAAKRIDTVAVALWSGLTVSDLVDLDLGYAPPFSPVWDPIQVAARKLVDKI